MADFEAPGLSGPSATRRKSTKADRLYDELKSRISGAANKVALTSLGPEVAAANRKLSPGQMQHLTALYDDKLRTVSAKTRPTKKPGVHVSTFATPGYLEMLRTEGLAGQLANSGFRSVSWKIYLGVLPEDYEKWEAALLEVRSNYDAELKKWVVDPYTLADSTDLVKNNPLAIDDDAPWQRHFQDEQFRKQIQQDITRTFPSLEFFRRQQVQEDLLNILFCYARSHPDLSYRQGMHELLAGLYYIVATDAGAASPSPSPSAGGATSVSANGRNASGSNGEASNGSTNGASRDAGSASGGGGAGEASGEHGRVEAALRMVNDPAYIAHDAAALFAMVMEVAAGWFAQTQEEVQQQRKKALEEHTPFASPSVDAGAKSIVMVRLERIHDRILKGFDSELYHRLQVLDIPPQIYGLRWIRVLFAREFNMEDTFRIWDAIFADSASLALTDYIFVATLCYRRKELTTGDLNTCLKLLMSPLELVSDVQHIVELALHIRDPRLFPRPAPFEDAQIVAARAAAEAAAVAKAAAAAARLPTAAGTDRLPTSRHGSMTNVIPPSAPRPSATSIAAAAAASRPPPAQSPASSDGFTSPETSRPSSVSGGGGEKGRVHPPNPSKGAALLMNELQGRLERLHADNAKHGLLLATYIGQLKEELLATDRLPDDDVIFAALSGIGVVKDALLGNSTAI
eukprot:m.446815 g.446815  ORF g.446815 m.446815 type:complete len:686 (-) comp19427_c0_seq1:233-2290(-)